MDFSGLFKNVSSPVEVILTLAMIVISFSLVDMFDTVSTLLGTARQANMLVENGKPLRMKEAMMCDAVATTVGACVGSSTATVFVESSTGIAEGGRTGLTALVTSLLFLAALVTAPFITVIPTAATAPALIFVGVLMMGAIREVDFSDVTAAIPACITAIFMPFTYSIANGIAFRADNVCADPAFDGQDEADSFSDGCALPVVRLAFRFHGERIKDFFRGFASPVIGSVRLRTKNKRRYLGIPGGNDEGFYRQNAGNRNGFSQCHIQVGSVRGIVAGCNGSGRR